MKRADSSIRRLGVLVCGLALMASGSASSAEPPSAIVIDNCSVFDSEAGQMVDGRTIVIRGERIESVVATGEPVSVPAEARRIDGRGKFAIPGLIDAHVHVVHILDFAQVTGDEVLPLYLAAGVTSIRSTGDEIVAATLVARHAQRHPESSPRLFTCSPLIDADPPIHRDIGRGVTDPAQVPALIDELSRWDVTTLKIYARTGPEVGKAVIDEGHRHGIFVTAHLGAYSAQQAVADGVDGLEHIWSVFNYVIPPEITSQPGHRGRVDFDTPVCESLIAELVKHKVMVDPTLTVFRNMILLPDVPEVHDHPDNALVPQRLRDFWPVYLQRTGCPQGGPLEDRQREFAKFQELTGKLHRAGVPLLVGTDAPEPQCTPGFSLHQEMELMVGSGLSPAEVLSAATLNNAKALRQQEEIGSIAAGKVADLVLLDADPLEDIRNTRKIGAVIHRGHVADPAELLKLVSRE
jgi:hypothetical protein